MSNKVNCPVCSKPTHEGSHLNCMMSIVNVTRPSIHIGVKLKPKQDYKRIAEQRPIKQHREKGELQHILPARGGSR